LDEGSGFRLPSSLGRRTPKQTFSLWKVFHGFSAPIKLSFSVKFAIHPINEKAHAFCMDGIFFSDTTVVSIAIEWTQKVDFKNRA